MLDELAPTRQQDQERAAEPPGHRYAADPSSCAACCARAAACKNACSARCRTSSSHGRGRVADADRGRRPVPHRARGARALTRSDHRRALTIMVNLDQLQPCDVLGFGAASRRRRDRGGRHAAAAGRAERPAAIAIVDFTHGEKGSTGSAGRARPPRRPLRARELGLRPTPQPRPAGRGAAWPTTATVDLLVAASAAPRCNRGCCWRRSPIDAHPDHVAAAEADRPGVLPRRTASITGRISVKACRPDDLAALSRQSPDRARRSPIDITAVARAARPQPCAAIASQLAPPEQLAT